MENEYNFYNEGTENEEDSGLGEWLKEWEKKERVVDRVNRLARFK